MDQLVSVNKENWKVVLRSNDNRMVLYNPHSNEFRTTNSSSNFSKQWTSSSYFQLLENQIKNDQENIHQSINEYLLDGYFSKYFRVQKKIGSGGASSVYHVIHHLANYDLAEYAVKIIPIGVFSRLKKSLFEVKFLQKLSLLHHPFILGYYHCWIENYQPALLGPEIPCLFILMEYSPIGNLEDFLQKNKNLSYKSKWQIFIQIVLTIHLLHKEKIIHRDLKMSNILVFADKNAENPLQYKFVLSDFGTATSEKSQISKFASNRTGATGTIETMAPELLEQDDNGSFLHIHNYSSDIWSLGVILFSIFVGKNPFASNDGEELLRNFTNVDNLLNKLGFYNINVSNEVMSLIRKMMVKRPYLRISIDDLLDDQVIKRHIHDFNYDYLLLNDSNSNDDNSDQNSNSSLFLLPVNNSTSICPIKRKKRPNFHFVPPNNSFTEEEFNKSVPLPITYAPKSDSQHNVRFKLFLGLTVCLACLQFPKWIYYFIHFFVSFIILFSSLKYFKSIFLLPIIVGIETFVFPSNSFFLSLLVLVLIILLQD